jgi:hypothetical protein
MTGRWLARDGLIVTAITWTPATTGCDCAATAQSA